MTKREIATYCRICEPQCGLLATVEDGRITAVRGDKQHAHSEGFSCSKAAGMIDVTYDPDRVTTPLRRVGGPGEFEAVSWEEALSDIAARLRRLRAEHGADAFATFLGNPPAFGYATAMAYTGFQQALGVRWKYCINSEDASARMAANALLYGSVAMLPVPDLRRTDFAVLVGANPVVSRGSLISVPNLPAVLDGIIERGGRVVVIDPRRSETAARYEHIPLRAGSDPHLLLGLLHTLVTENLVDRAFVADHTTGYDRFAELVGPYSPEAGERYCGVPAEVVRSLARAFAAAPTGVVYGRTGTCTQRFGTFNNVLQDFVMVLTGNVGRAGGQLPPWGPVDFAKFAEKAGFATYGAEPTRVTGMPDVFGMHPSTALVPDITTPGPGRVRGLMTVGANPVSSSAGGGPAMEAALEDLDLHFSLDLYVNETTAHAHYVLPVPGMYERDDIPLPALGLQLRPAIWATEAVIEPVGDVRPEWQILNDIARRAGAGGAYAVAPLRWLARGGVAVPPRTLVDALIRTSKAGDWFGLRRDGVSFRKLTAGHPHGKRLRDELPVPPFEDWMKTPDRKVALASAAIVGEFDRLARTAGGGPDEFPLRVCGLREKRSHNSWMHNVERLMPDSRRHTARVHPADAAAAGLVDGDRALITSASGSIEVTVLLTDEMTPGNIAVPHGWGHRGGWQRANRAGGVNPNALASSAVADLDPLGGMSILSGIPVRLARVPAPATPAAVPTA